MTKTQQAEINIRAMGYRIEWTCFKGSNICMAKDENGKTVKNAKTLIHLEKLLTQLTPQKWQT